MNLERVFKGQNCCGVEMNYDTSYSCEINCIDDYCRCGEIIDIVCKSVDVSYICHALCKEAKIKKASILEYAVDRIIRHHKIYDTELWDGIVGGGYYGEEFEGTTFEKSDLIINDIENLIGKKDKTIVEFLLTQEYGYLLENVRGLNWEIKKISRSQLILGQDDYAYKVKSECLEVYKDHSLASGVCVWDGNTYRLVDGYHRNLASNSDKITMIVGK